MKKKVVIWGTVILILILIVSITVYSLVRKDSPSNGGESQIPNPASQYCVEQGNNFTIRTNGDGSQTGYCVSSNGTECEEWAFFRGECKL